MSEERNRDRALLGPMHGIVIADDEPARNDHVGRGYQLDCSPYPERPAFADEWSEPGGWVTREIEDGAELFFGPIE